MTALGGPLPPGYGPPPPPAEARMSPMAIVAVFIGVLLGLSVVVGAVILFNAPPPPDPQCQPGEPCTGPPEPLPPIAGSSPFPTTQPGSSPALTPQPTLQPTPLETSVPTPGPTGSPTSDSPPVVTGTIWSDEDLGYSFEYDEELFTLGQSEPGLAVLNGTFFDAQIVVRGDHAETSPSQMLRRQLEVVDRFLIGRVRDDDPYDALLGPSIGYVRGEGGVFAGTIVSQDGTPLAPGGVTILASTDGRITVSIVVIVGTPDALLGSDTHQNAVRSAADEILKTFDWDTR